MDHPRAVQQPICTHQHPPPVVMAARQHRITLLATAMLHHLPRLPTPTISHLHMVLSSNPPLIPHLIIRKASSSFPHRPHPNPPKMLTRIIRNMLPSNLLRRWLGHPRLDCNTLLFAAPRPPLIPPCRIGPISHKACTQQASSQSASILLQASNRHKVGGQTGSGVCGIRETCDR